MNGKASTPYSVIVSPATPEKTKHASPHRFTVVKCEPEKTFCMNGKSGQTAPPEPFFLHQNKSSNSPPTSIPAIGHESKKGMATPRGRSRNSQSGKRPVRSKSSDGMIEYAALDFFMTDTKYQTADCSASEKQVRFSMTTFRTPPNSPKPCFPSKFTVNPDMPLVPATNPLVRKSPSSYKVHHDIKDDLKVNNLEKLEVLPESQA